ncbi:hypothetical protein D915_008033 [Fasciola hepatica]|uniref:SH3 domain-containing protein n=1 Tax=Fasciola hepatica TaxID=6192 RepID=A0A4E0R1N5_FASHE|nr:hypothetical protein D915_008033 [Fasciola hepatica]
MEPYNVPNESSWQLTHMATFAERHLHPRLQEFGPLIERLDQRSLSLSQCFLTLNERGLEIFNEAFRTKSLFHWDKIIEYADVSTPGDHSEELFVLRIKHSGIDLLGFRNEVLVFKHNETSKAASLTKTLFAEEKKRKSAGNLVDGSNKTSSRKKTDSSPLDCPYGESLYMLNRCLDDIEFLAKKLKKYIKKQEDSSRNNSVRPPSPEDAIEAVQKAKFALNLAESVKQCAPEAFTKVFIRMITFVDWMDELCEKYSIIPNYPQNLVRDVVEPLLQENTLGTIRGFMESKLQQKWSQLGPAWNKSPENWSSPLPGYTPHFRSIPRYVSTVENGWINQHLFHRHGSRRRRAQSVGQNELDDPADTLLLEITKPVIPTRQYAEDFEEIQNQGKRLCFATVPHLGARRQELGADQGEIFELLDDSAPYWWQVRNHSGHTGLIPAWKLRSVRLTGDLMDLRPPGSIRSEATLRSRSKTLPPFEYWYRESTTLSQRDRIRAQSYGPINRVSMRDSDLNSTNDFQPMVVYIPTETLEENRPLPILLFPYCNRQHSSTISMSTSPRRQFEQTMDSTFDLQNPTFSTMTKENTLYGHPRVPSVYSPTIKLDRRSSFIAGKV